MKHDQFQLKLTYGNVADLCQVYTDILPELTWESDWDKLLMAHARSFKRMLERKLALENKSYTITLELEQAMAFQQMWRELAKAGVQLNDGGVIRLSMEALDKTQKQFNIIQKLNKQP